MMKCLIDERHAMGIFCVGFMVVNLKQIYIKIEYLVYTYKYHWPRWATILKETIHYNVDEKIKLYCLVLVLVLLIQLSHSFNNLTNINSTGCWISTKKSVSLLALSLCAFMCMYLLAFCSFCSIYSMCWFWCVFKNNQKWEKASLRQISLCLPLPLCMFECCFLFIYSCLYFYLYLRLWLCLYGISFSCDRFIIMIFVSIQCKPNEMNVYTFDQRAGFYRRYVICISHICTECVHTHYAHRTNDCFYFDVIHAAEVNWMLHI